MINVIAEYVKDHGSLYFIAILWDIKTLFLMRYSIPFLLFLTFSCSPSVSVYYDYDRQINLSEYKTFDWKMLDRKESIQNPLYDNELNDKRIRSAVDKALSNKQYQRTVASPELLIHYHLVIEDKSVAIRESDIHNYSTYWLGSDMSTYQYKEGTLIIDLMDAKTSALVWRGWAVTILEDLNPQNVEKKLDRTIERIFEGLPTSVSK